MTVALLLTAAIGMTSAADPTAADIVQRNFKDATFQVKVVKGNQHELKKINDDFAQSYQFKSVHAYVKEPYMMRLESKVGDTSLSYTINGAKKHYNVGGRINKTDDISNAPGKRQTPMDFGVLTPSLFENYFVATFVRVDRETGDLIFDLTYVHPKFDDTSRHRVWVDKNKRYITKRVWFSQEGKQLATFTYENPQNSDGVWFPTRCTVRNTDNAVAGVSEYSAIKINSGLSDSIFKF